MRDFVTVVVEDPVHPSSPIDLTDQVEIRRGGLRLESNPRIVRSHYQQVTITNTSLLPLAGPVYLAVTGQSVTVNLEFLNQGNASIEYTAKVYHGVAK